MGDFLISFQSKGSQALLEALRMEAPRSSHIQQNKSLIQQNKHDMTSIYCILSLLLRCSAIPKMHRANLPC